MPKWYDYTVELYKIKQQLKQNNVTEEEKEEIKEYITNYYVENITQGNFPSIGDTWGRLFGSLNDNNDFNLASKWWNTVKDPIINGIKTVNFRDAITDIIEDASTFIKEKIEYIWGNMSEGVISSAFELIFKGIGLGRS